MKPDVAILLDNVWRNLMDDADKEALARADGVVEGFMLVRHISEIEAEAWWARLRRCHDMETEGAHIGGRQWCAYCGDVQKAEAKPEVTEADRSRCLHLLRSDPTIDALPRSCQVCEAKPGFAGLGACPFGVSDPYRARRSKAGQESGQEGHQ